MLVGAPLTGRVLIVDDVMTAGTAVRESLALIRAQGATPAGVLDCAGPPGAWHGERGPPRRKSLRITASRCIAIANLADVLAYAGDRAELATAHAALIAYRARYGVQS